MLETFITTVFAKQTREVEAMAFTLAPSASIFQQHFQTDVNLSSFSFSTNGVDYTKVAPTLSGGVSTYNCYIPANATKLYIKTSSNNYKGYLRIGSTTSSVVNSLIKEVDHWNDFYFSNISFRSATSLTKVPSTLPESITDIQFMFYGCSAFNQSVNFDTSKVTNMSYMFTGCSAFNQSVNFDTSRVTNMVYMFSGCVLFNNAVTFSDTSKVTHMGYMFYGCRVFNQPLNFNTVSVIDTSNMFSGCNNFNQPLNFNTANVTNMNNMLYGCNAFNSTVTFSDTSKVTNMGYMFFGCKVFNQPINFDTSRVTNLEGMFFGCNAFNKPINFNTTNVTNMKFMFRECSKLNSAITFNDVSNVLDISELFKDCLIFNQNLSYLNFKSSVTRTNYASNTPIWLAGYRPSFTAT